jgi:DNA-directed RNA polymerase subunit RPC12/RpoP
MIKKYPANVVVVMLECDKCSNEMKNTGETLPDGAKAYQCTSCDFRIYSINQYPYTDISPDYSNKPIHTSSQLLNEETP